MGVNYGDTKFLLRNGLSMPAVGFGTYRIRDNDTMYWALDTALRIGYRLFDTAEVYRNEQIIGDAFRQLLPRYGLAREDIFVTTKLAPFNHGTGKVERALDHSLERLGLDYVDLYLIHFPGSAHVKAEDFRNRTLRHETWEEMIQVYEKGKAHAIGVSNFTVAHLNDLNLVSPLKPLLNQVEWHPHYFQPELLNYCKANGICLQAYSSFGGLSSGANHLVEEIVLQNIAKKHGLTVHQVLLLWALQNDVAVIPKSVTSYRIDKNHELSARLSQEDLEALNGLNINHKYAWDPSPIP